MLERRILAAAAAAVYLFLAGCSSAPECIRVPAQRQLQADPFPSAEFVEMSDFDAPAYIVKDIAKPDGSKWLWTFAEPELRFHLNSASERRFVMDFGIPPANFQVTGPVTVSVFLDGRFLAQMHCDAPGDRRLEHTVPAAWINTAGVTTIIARVDKHNVAATDGVKLGFTLFRAGFLP